jgi:zinc protease
LPNSLIKPAVSGFLPNGLKYIIQTDTSNPVLCLQLYVRTGSAWETAAESGYSHFLEHLAFKSTKDFGYNEITQYVNSLGGSINAYTDFDCTCFYLLLPSEYLREGLKVLSELALAPGFTRSDVKMEKDIIIEEMMQTENDPEMDFLEFIQRSAFANNPLKQPVLGTSESVRKATSTSLKEFHTAQYSPRNSFLVIAGDAAPGPAAYEILGSFGRWQDKEAPRKEDPGKWSEPSKPPSGSVWRTHGHAYLAYLLPELCDTHPSSDPLLIAIRYLAIGRSSRLFKRLVEDEKLASSVKVTSYCGVFTGVSAIVISPLGEDLFGRIDAIFREEYKSLLEGNLDPKETNLVKKDIINTWRYGFEGMENLANMIGAEEFIDGFEKLYSYDRQIEPLGLDDVIGAIKLYWHPDYLQVVSQSSKNPDFYHNGVITRKRARAVANGRQPLAPISYDRNTPQGIPLDKVGQNLYMAVLPNGLRFLYEHIPGQPISGFALAANVSQLDERREQRGINYLCSTAMLHSTQNISYSDILTLFREHGISMHTEPHADTTVFSGKCFHSELAVALGILAEMVYTPAFEEDFIRLVKTTSIDFLRRDMKVPTSMAFFHWFNLLYGPSGPYGRYSGNISDLKRHSREEVQAWFAENYRPERFSLAVVGSGDPENVLTLVAGYFDKTGQSEPAKVSEPEPPKPAISRRIMSNRNSGQAIIHLGGFAPPAYDRIGTTAFHLLAHIVGGDMDSRLFNLVREKYGYAYQTGLEYNCVKNTGHWFAYAYCDPDDYKPCLKLMREIIAEVCRDGVSPEELQHAKNYLCGMNRFESESASLQAVSIATLNSLGYEPEFYLQREERIRSIDLEDICRVATSWLQTSNQWIHILL